MNGVSGQDLRAASSMCSVPSAFTSKSSSGMAAARSCEGWAAVCTIRLGRNSSMRANRASRSRISSAWWLYPGISRLNRSSTQLVSPSGPKKTARWLLSIPATRKPWRPKNTETSEPISPQEPDTNTEGVDIREILSGISVLRIPHLQCTLSRHLRSRCEPRLIDATIVNALMTDFPAFMKQPANRIANTHQATPGVEGYIFDGADGSQMAFWTCQETAASAEHVHDYDEYMLVVEGCYTLLMDGQAQAPL